MGETEGGQSPGSAVGRLFQLRWQGNTLCDCTSALPHQHRRVSSWLQPAAAPASLSHRADGGGADAGWNRQAVGQRGVPGGSNSPAISSHPAGPASCRLPRAKHLHASQQGGQVPVTMPARSHPTSPASVPGPGCHEQLSSGMGFHGHRQTPYPRKASALSTGF